MKHIDKLLIIVIFCFVGCAQDSYVLKSYRQQYVFATSHEYGKSGERLKVFIADYQNNDPDGLVPQARKLLADIEAQEFALASSSSEFKSFIAKWQDNDPDGLVPQATQRIPDLEAQEKVQAHAQYLEKFASASSASDFQEFIDKYQDNDPDHLILKAKKKYKTLAAKDARELAANEIRVLSSIIEHDAVLFKKDKDSLYLINSLVGLVKGNDFTCDTVSAARPMLLSRGFVLTCNKFRYSYDIQDKGGHWQVVAN